MLNIVFIFALLGFIFFFLSKFELLRFVFCLNPVNFKKINEDKKSHRYFHVLIVFVLIDLAVSISLDRLETITSKNTIVIVVMIIELVIYLISRRQRKFISQ